MTKQKICNTSDLISNSGICALVEANGVEHQIAVFYIPESDKKVFAINNWDPLGQANVLSRGIIGSVDGELVVASPLYKQHFSLISGKCLEEETSVPTYDISVEDDAVYIAA